MSEPLGVLLLPVKLEDFELAEHSRDLLEIPRVLAFEPGRVRTPRMLRDVVPFRQVRRLRLPGEPRVAVLYHPAQYRFARALCGRYGDCELWYFRPDPTIVPTWCDYRVEELVDLDQLARERAGDEHTVSQNAGAECLRGPLRLRLRELEIISPHPFAPRGRPLRR